jgi:hypothetical protein
MILLIAFAGALGVMRSGAPATGLAISPEIVSFTATPSVISPGETVTVAWKTRSTAAVAIEFGPASHPRGSFERRDDLPSSGTLTFKPTEDTIFVLECDTVFGAMCMSASTTVRMK